MVFFESLRGSFQTRLILSPHLVNHTPLVETGAKSLPVRHQVTTAQVGHKGVNPFTNLLPVIPILMCLWILRRHLETTVQHLSSEMLPLRSNFLNCRLCSCISTTYALHLWTHLECTQTMSTTCATQGNNIRLRIRPLFCAQSVTSSITRALHGSTMS